MKVRLWAEQGLRLACICLPWLVLGYGFRFFRGAALSTGLEVILLGLAVLFTMCRGFKGWRLAWRELPSRWLLVLWALSGLAAIFWSPSIAHGFALWRPYFLEPFIAILIVHAVLKTKEDRDYLRLAFWSVITVIGLWSVVEFITGKGIPHPWNVSIADGRRGTGPYGYPNAVALFVAPIAAYAGARFWILREKLAGVAALCALLGVLAARSDGGTLAILAAWGLAMLFSKPGRIILGVSSVLAVVACLIRPDLATLIWHGLTFHGWSGQVRLYIWRETWQMLKAHWFLGAGLGGYPIVFDAFHKARAIEIFQYPHQFIFTAWSEGGLIGLGAFLALLVDWGRRAYQSSVMWAQRVIGFAPLVAIIIHGLVDVPYWKNDLAVTFFLLWWLVAWTDGTYTTEQAAGNTKHA